MLHQPPHADEVERELGATPAFSATTLERVTVDAVYAGHFTLTNRVDGAGEGCTHGDLLPIFRIAEPSQAGRDSVDRLSPAARSGTKQEIWTVDLGFWTLLVVAEVGQVTPEVGQTAIDNALASMAIAP